MTDVVTLPEACRVIGKSRAWGERIYWAYRETLPPPTRAGIVRVFPASIVERLREIARREEEAKR